MVDIGDTRDYTGSGLRRIIPYVQFELLVLLCLDVCCRGYKLVGRVIRDPSPPGVGELCSLKAYVCFGVGCSRAL
jgi:hypothetical protein